MSLRQDGRHGLRIARAEFVRSLRGYIGSKRRLAGLAIALLFFGGNLLIALPSVYFVGQTARSVASIPYFAPVATAIPIGLVALAALRTLERIGRIDAPELILTTVHPRAVVFGLMGAEIARLAIWIGIPLLAVTSAFAVGLGSPSFLLSAALVGLPLLCWAAVCGYALGISILLLLRRLPSVHRLLKIVGVVVLVVFVAGSQFLGRYLVEGGFSGGAVASRFALPPVADYVALAFVGTPLARSVSLGSLAVLVGLLALTPLGLSLATRQVSRLWFTDAATQADTQPAQPSTGRFRPPAPFKWWPAGHVAWAVLVRAKRQPQELAHLMMAVFFIAPIGSTITQSPGDGFGLITAGIGVGFGAYLAGATFGLNPLGDDRPQFPLLLLTQTAPRTLVRGRLLAGLAIGLPIATLVPLVSTLLGTPLLDAVVLAVTGVWMCLAAALFAVGLGAVYPIYDEREFWGTVTVVPSTIVMLVYLFVVTGGIVIGLLTTWYGLSGHLTATPLVLVGLGVYLTVTFGVSYGSYRYAVRCYQRYSLP